MEEIWKDIKGYENRYQISNFGNVRNKKTLKNRKLSKHKTGRLFIVLTNINQEKQTHFIHKLVAINFLNHKPSYFIETVDHIDYNPLNNRIDNLQLMSLQDNLIRKIYRTNDKIEEFFGDEILNLNQKVTQKLIAEITGIGIATIKRRFKENPEYKQIVKEFNKNLKKK